MRNVKNPIVRGFNPDPSVCKVGEDYYLVTSTFEFFPGVPIYHSRDLANWKLIGHCLTRKSQLLLDGCQVSGGIYAPTLRYHDGMFYMSTTNCSHGGNFIVHAKDIQGPWSEPSWVEQGGIDPSLTFDEGRCYLQSAHQWEGRQCILQCEVNPLTGEMLTPSKPISYGTGGKYPEAPHLYKINGQYYLVLAEGGTEYGHMVTIFRSDSPWGPFEPCPRNPILSHRGADAVHSQIQCVGHAELFEWNDGRWWLAALGIRKLPYNLLHNLGRESFLAQVTWDEDGWPVVNGNGLLNEQILLDTDEDAESDDFFDDFSESTLKLDYCHVRNPYMENYHLGDGMLTLYGGEPLSTMKSSPTFLGVRQKEFNVVAEVCVQPEEGALAGMCAYYSGEHYYALSLSTKNGRMRVSLRKRMYDFEAETASVEVDAQKLYLQITADVDKYAFACRTSQGEWIPLGEGAVAALCTEVTRTMTFTGTFIGLFCEQCSSVFSSFSVKYPKN